MKINSLAKERFLTFSSLLKLLQEAGEEDVRTFIKQTLDYQKKITFNGMIIQQEYPEDLLEFVFKHAEPFIQDKLRQSLVVLIDELISKLYKLDKKTPAYQNNLDMFRSCLILLKIFEVKENEIFVKLIELADSGQLKGQYSYDKREMHAELLRVLFHYVYYAGNNNDIKEKILSLAEKNLNQSPYTFVSLRALWDAYPEPKANEKRIKYIKDVMESSAYIPDNTKKKEYIDQLASTLQYLFYVSGFEKKDIALFIAWILYHTFSNQIYKFILSVLDHIKSLHVIPIKFKSGIKPYNLGSSSHVDRIALAYRFMNSPKNTNPAWCYAVLFKDNSGNEEEILHVVTGDGDKGIHVLTSEDLIKFYKEKGFSNEQIGNKIFYHLREEDVENDPVLKEYLEYSKTSKNNENSGNNGQGVRDELIKMSTSIEDLRKNYTQLKRVYRILSRYIDTVKSDIEYLKSKKKIFIAVDTEEIISFILSAPLYNIDSKNISINDLRHIIAETYVFCNNIRSSDNTDRLFERVISPPSYLYELRDLLELYHKKLLTLEILGSDQQHEKLREYLRKIWRNLNSNERGKIREILKRAKDLLKEKKYNRENVKENNEINEVVKGLLKILKERFPEYYLILSQSFGNGLSIIEKLLEERRIDLVEEALNKKIYKGFDDEIKLNYSIPLQLPKEILSIKSEFEKITYRENKGEWPNLYDAMAIHFVSKFNSLYAGESAKMILFSDSPAMQVVGMKLSEQSSEIGKLVSNLQVRDSNYFVVLLSLLGDDYNRSKHKKPDYFFDKILEGVQKESDYIAQFLKLQGILDSANAEDKQDDILEKLKEYKEHYDNFISLKMIQQREKLLRFYDDLAKNSKKQINSMLTFEAVVYQLTRYILDEEVFENPIDDLVEKEIKEYQSKIRHIIEDLYKNNRKLVERELFNRDINSIYIDFRRFREIPWGIDFEDEEIKKSLEKFNNELEYLKNKNKTGKRGTKEITNRLNELLDLYINKNDKVRNPEYKIIIPLILFGLRQYEEAFYITMYEKNLSNSLDRRYIFPYSLLAMLIASKLMVKYSIRNDDLSLAYYYRQIQDIYSNLKDIGRDDDPRIINLIAVARFRAKIFGMDQGLEMKNLLKSLHKAYNKAREEGKTPLELMTLNNILFFAIKEFETDESLEENKKKELISIIKEKTSDIESTLNNSGKREKYINSMYEITDTLLRAYYLLYRWTFLSDKQEAISYLKNAQRYCKELRNIISPDLKIDNYIQEAHKEICPEIEKIYNLFMHS